MTVMRPSRCAADQESAAAVPLDEGQRLGSHVNGGIITGVGVADLGVSMLDEEPVVAVAG